MKALKFVKEGDTWYIDLPEWKGSKADLMMVFGSDTLLDILAKGNNEVSITANETFFEGSFLLKLTGKNPEDGGGWYYVDKYKMDMWLCDVTKFVYGYMPKELHIKQV